MSMVGDILKRARDIVTAYRPEPEIEEIGEVLEVQDGVARVRGLRKAVIGETLLFGSRKAVRGQVLGLERESLQCILFGDYTTIHAGDQVFRTRTILEVPAGEELLSRVVNPLGEPLDDRGPITCRGKRPVFFPAPQVIDRVPVQRPLFSGIKIIDAMIPLGKGQRELIIGDRQTGKTTIALDTIINQRGKGVICIYVAIGQRLANITQVVEILRKFQALEYTTIVATSSEDPPALVYLAPYAGCAMGEYFMYRGEDVLIVYDDLTKHAVAYRSLSLLLRRPPGRESYPGDIFYIHSSLLERGAQLAESRGGGSMTALPIVETQEGDIASYIPTNIISITDGQIYLETGLFNKGFLPAINIGLSVSRVGGEAQTSIMKKVARRLRLHLAQYFELEEFARFGADLDELTRRQLEHGKRVLALMTQTSFAPLPLSIEIMEVFAATQGFLDPVPLERVKEWERAFVTHLREEHATLLERLEKERDLTHDLEEEMRRVLANFNERFLQEAV
jgi:F-type H+-transporting ATPase subunit alpha